MEEKFLNPSMVHNTVETYEIVCRLDHSGKLDESPKDKKKQKAAKALLSNELQKQDSAKPVSLRVSRILAPVSRFRTAQILPQMNLASRASRPGLTVGFLRIPQHVEKEEQMCRVGCLDEPDSLSHCNECPLLYNFFASVCRQATVPPRRGHLLHDLIAQVSPQSLQYGIVVDGCHRCLRLRPQPPLPKN